VVVTGTLPTDSNVSLNYSARGTAPSGSTTQLSGFNSYPATAAASFTCAEVSHFNAANLTIGAGSTVTNQIGFKANNTLTGATNNYGFYGNIASGSNRYNVYMAGTADNYFAGNVGIGGTAAATAKVQVLGTLPSSGTLSFAYHTTAEVPSGTTGAAVAYHSKITTAAASFTLGTAAHFLADPPAKGAGSTITNQMGFYAESTLTGATNNYGFYSNIASGSNRWNFYAAGTAKNYFAGNVGVGVDPGSNTFAALGPSGANASYALTSQSGYGTFLNMGVNGGNRFEISVNTGGDLSFTTNGLSADVMKITRASSVSNTLTLDKGEVLCGNATDNGAYNLQCNGTGVWGAGAYVNGSDARLKDDIATLNDGLNVVSQLRPVTFKYKPDYSKDQNVQTGFIAQELQTVLAGKDYVDGIVQAGPNHLNVAYQSLIPILVKAIQELTARVAELEAK
jgi:hypothetical protein